ncbi:DEAD/DEAH box helicase [Amycolatopsis viridis]|uniref:Superfamily II DNA or RNA helicase n=1 Tax=Amycolatopsis viridis TaxID=185678 RepID=A0ABX0SV62_9PSEU|nr:superfamily II DNA or RNA helicase [Amycolatopsis viridis]
MDWSGTTRAIFVPSEPPRDGVLAVWGDEPGPTPVELVLPGAGRSVHRTRVEAHVLPLADALPRLLAAGDGSPGLRAWSAAVAAGADLVSRGRVRPVPGPGEVAAWRAGPLDRADEELLRDLAAALPPEAHALPLSGLKRIRLHSPETLVRALWDATADVLAGGGAADGAQLQLRVEVRETGDGFAFAGVLALRSRADPSLVVDAAALPAAPAAVRSRFGGQVQAQLLVAVRRAARAWAPLGRLLGAAAPAELSLDDTEVVELLDDGRGALAAAGVEVLWPSGLAAEPVRVRASVTPSPGGEGVFRLSELLRFRWQLSVGEQTLTDAEVTALAEAKRPLVRLRGRWVRVDDALLSRLRGTRRAVTGARALAAALTGELELGDEHVDFAAPPALAGLVARLRVPGEPVEPDAGLQATLRPYQRAGVSWLARMTELGLGGVLADDMGLGKTIQLIALHLHRRALGAGPTLVLCPMSLLGNWEREVARFAPTVPVRRFHGGGRHLTGVKPDEIVLATYGVLRRDGAALSEVDWGLVAADEAQHVKNPQSVTAGQLRRVPAAARVALTGTPVENRLTDLWSILDWTTPGLLGTLEHFRCTTVRPVERHRDAAAADRLAATVRPFLLRRRKTDPDIAPELPRKTETDRYVPLTAEQATLYEAVVRENLAVIRESRGVRRRGQVLKLLTELKQICNHPAQYLKETGPLPGRSGKLAAFEELLDVILDEGESVLVFSQYVRLCRLLAARLGERGVPVQLLSGADRAGEREVKVARFQRGDVPVFLLSLKAGGVGLNLTRATHVIHYDRWWNPAVEDQATDRAHRIGQDRPVQVHRLVAEGTVEERVAAVLAGKRRLAEGVVGSGEDWITDLSDEELTTLVRLGEPGRAPAQVRPRSQRR